MCMMCVWLRKLHKYVCHSVVCPLRLIVSKFKVPLNLLLTLPHSSACSPEAFVVCEREKFQQLSRAAGSCFQVVSEREKLQGYRVGVVKEWVLNKARYVDGYLHRSIRTYMGNYLCIFPSLKF